MTTSHSGGHKIVFIDNKWIYSDTKKSISEERPCIKCNRMPTKEGHDACLGHIEGVMYACCGHGVSEPITIKEK